jgi:hypothetical protein
MTKLLIVFYHATFRPTECPIVRVTNLVERVHSGERFLSLWPFAATAPQGTASTKLCAGVDFDRAMGVTSFPVLGKQEESTSPWPFASLPAREKDEITDDGWKYIG